MSKKTTKNRISDLLVALNQGVYEKETVIRLSLLAAIAGESIFLLGAPGVAKSLVARRLKLAFKDAKSFDYLMNRFSTPDELFGPVSISKLKNDDKYERIVGRYLPDSEVVFLDEIWKASPSIQNTLLTVLNEKVFRNGEQEIKVPMKALIAASNELPAEGEGLEALYDRFLVRYNVESIENNDAFNTMITMKNAENAVAENLQITADDYELWQLAIEDITVPENVLNVIMVIRNYINEHNEKQVEADEKQLYVSDRRWRKIVQLLRTSAFLNDRAAVDLMDCFLIADCIWDETMQCETVKGFVRDAIQKHGYTLDLDLKPVKKQLEDLDKDVQKETSYVKKETTTSITLIDGKYLRILGLKGFFTYENEDLIDADDFLKLKADNGTTIVRRDTNNQTSDVVAAEGVKARQIQLKVSNKWHHFDIATHDEDEDITLTKKPHHAVAKSWDKKIAIVLTQTSNRKSQIQHFRDTDLKHVRTNLFVDKEYAPVVESHLDNILKNIEMLEIEVNQIKDYYQNIEAEKQLDIKKIS